MSSLPERLYAAHNWISGANEWDEALADPNTYANAAAANAFAHNVNDVAIEDLVDVINWYKIETAIRSKKSAAMRKAISTIKERGVDNPPDSVEEVTNLFEALYERKPDELDGEPTRWWSLCCDAVLPAKLRGSVNTLRMLLTEVKDD